MARRFLLPSLLGLLAIALGAALALRRERDTPAPPSAESAAAHQLERLAATLAIEAGQRQRLEQRLEALALELAALRARIEEGEVAVAPPGDSLAALEPAADELGDEADLPADHAAGAAPTGVATEVASDDASSIERALVAAGVDPATAADIKRRRDELALSELYLRDQAEREQWLDTPRFREEMAALEQQRTTVRDEIGDEAYDRYLAAAGEPNRVRVDEVMTDSAAAQAGLVAGDVVLRYGGVRVFAPGDLVVETRAGQAGETVPLELLRNGERVEVRVPRGPLGLRIAPGHAAPGE